MAKNTRSQYIKEWKQHNGSLFSVAMDAGVGADVDLVIEMQDHINKMNDYIEQVAELLVESGDLRSDIVVVK